jgi:hypothetical protein
MDPYRLNSVTAISHCGRSVSKALRIGPSSHWDDVVVLACGEPGRVKGRRTETVRES